MSALAADRKAAAVPDALVAADLDLAPDVGLDLAAQVTLDAVVGIDPVAQLDQVVVGQVADASVGADPRLDQRLLGAGAPDAIDVGERHLEPLFTRQVDAGKTCHPGELPSFVRRSSASPPRDCFAHLASRAPASAPGVSVVLAVLVRRLVRAM